MPLLDPNQTYTFSRYFELGFEASELAAEFGYSLTRKVLNLQQFPGELDRLQELQERITEVLPYVPLTSELARREIIIARVVTVSPVSYLLVKSYKYTNEPGASKKSICLPILSR